MTDFDVERNDRGGWDVVRVVDGERRDVAGTYPTEDAALDAAERFSEYA